MPLCKAYSLLTDHLITGKPLRSEPTGKVVQVKVETLGGYNLKHFRDALTS